MYIIIKNRVLTLSKPSYIQQSLFRMWALAKFELIRLFLTKRGMLAILAFITTWFLILYYPVNSAVTIVASDGFKGMAEDTFGILGLSALLQWQVAEFTIYWLIALYSFPIFALGASSDQTCADRTRGTLRFISLRATRNEIIFGRFIGQVLIIAILILLTLLATTTMAWLRESALGVPALLKASDLFVQLIIVVLPFIALTSFFNSFLRSAKLTSVVTLLFFGLGALFISLISYNLSIAHYLNYIFPGVQLSDIVGQDKLTLVHYSIPLIQTGCYLALASIFMKRSAL